MALNSYSQNLWLELAAVWDLCELVNQLPEDERCAPAKVLAQAVQNSSIIDKVLTETQSPSIETSKQIYCQNRYGIHFNEDMKMWLPFRHGSIDVGLFNQQA